MGAHSIRAARLEDSAAIQAINAAGEPGVAPLTTQEMEAIAAGVIRCWIAEAPDGISGYLIAYTGDDVYDGEEFAWFQQRYAAFLYIDQIAVAPEARRDGAGFALYQAAGNYALAHDCDALVCEVNVAPLNAVSLRFHRFLGFKDVGEMRTHDGRTVALLRL
ncbi:MAG: GNAT family N-acetyltransferase, partial [Ktedonobacterales bacterium]